MASEEEFFSIATETVVGRTKEDYQKFKTEATGYIGKHIVGTGEDTHLTTKVLIDFLKPHVILCSGKRGSGKCVTGDTLVYLNDGRILPIKEIVEKKEKIGLVSLDQQDFLLEESKAIEFFERNVDKVLKIKLWNGVEVKVTENHPLLTPFGWEEAKKIKAGDFIAIPSEIKINGNGFFPDNQIKLLSLLLGEGTIGETFVWFTNSDKRLVEDFCEAVKEFDESLKVIEYRKMTYRVIGTEPVIEGMNLKFSSKGFSKGTRIIVRRNKMLSWLDSLGLKNKRSGEKFIPSIIFSLPDEKVALFLRYLFACDGSLYKKKTRKGRKAAFVVEYSSKSKKLVEGVYYLLLRFGILSYLREKKVGSETYYRLLITDKENVKKFVTKIGFIGKEELIDEILNDKRKLHSNFDVLPREIWNYIRIKYKKKDIAKALGYKNPKGISTKYKYNPLKITIRKIGEFFNDDFLKKISSPSIAWMKVEKIENLFSPTKVYDLTVNDHHNFIGNGIILHNSYSAAVILEEFCQLEEDFRKKLAFVVVDPMGIYWSMKMPNEQQKQLLSRWGLEPKGFENVKVFVPQGLKATYEVAGIPVDYSIAISPKQFTPDDWALAFNLERTGELAITLEKNVNLLLEAGLDFDLEDIIKKINEDQHATQHTKNVLVSFLEVAKSWGIFFKQGMGITDIVKPGVVSVIDLSRVKGEEWGVRNLLAAWIIRNVYHERVLARKEEELAKVENRRPERTFPLTWVVLEEAHNFVPSDRRTVSTDPVLTLAKQGREPGISLVCITQMPNKVHQDVLSQTDIVISFRLTSRDDLQALHAVYQSYMQEELEKMINRLPRWPGAAIILDDNLERIFTVNIRPRLSWHAGGTAALI